MKLTFYFQLFLQVKENMIVNMLIVNNKIFNNTK